jgi:hypothetical protein
VLAPGTLDVGDNDLVLTAMPAGTFDGTTYTGVAGLAASGRLTTSRPDAAAGLTALAVASASDVLDIASIETAAWSGQVVSGSSVLVRYTYAGDATLDGKINIADYGQIDFHVGNSGSVFGWFNGDFNYDGKINIDDYGIIDFNVVAQGPPLAASAFDVVAVPEPAAMSLLIPSAAVLTARLRRRRAR